MKSTNSINITSGVAASVLSVFPIPVIAFIYSLAVGGIFSEAIEILFTWFFWLTTVTFLSTVVFGIPVFLSVFGYANFPLIVLCGAIGGYCICQWLFPYSGWQGIAAFTSLGSYCGAAYWYGATKLSTNKV